MPGSNIVKGSNNCMDKNPAHKCCGGGYTGQDLNDRDGCGQRTEAVSA